MFLSTMTNLENLREINKALPQCMLKTMEYTPIFIERVRKQTTSSFPYYNRFKFTDDMNNEWTMVFCCESKEIRRHCLISYAIYTTYMVKNKKAYIVIITGSRYAGSLNTYDIAPHAIERVMERYKQSHKKEEINPGKIIEKIMRSKQIFELSENEKRNKKYKTDDDTLVEADLHLLNGIFKGKYDSKHEIFNIYTYVHESMYFQEQTESEKNAIRLKTKLNKRESLKEVERYYNEKM